MISLTVFFILNGFGVSTGANANQGLSLSQVYDLALKQSESVEASKSRLEQRDAQATQARSGFFPRFFAQGQHTILDTNGLSQLERAAGRDNQTSARVGVTQNLFMGGRTLAETNAASSMTEAQASNVEFEHVNLYSNVANIYFGVLIDEHEVANLKQALELLRDRVKELKKRSQIGRSRNSEVLTAESQLSALRSQFEAARAALEMSRSRLARIANISSETPLFDVVTMPQRPEPLEKYLGLKSKRPDILSLQKQADAFDSQITVARSEYFPQLDAFGNYYLYRKGANQNMKWDVGLSLTIPLFDGLATLGKSREAHSRVYEAQWALRSRERDAEVEIRVAHKKLVSLIEQYKIMEDAVKSAEKNYQAQSRDYQNSLVSNLEVLQALNTLQEFRRSFDRTRYNAHIAAVELAASTGQIQK